MTSFVWGDVDRALTLVREAASAREKQPFEKHVIERLLELVPADRAGCYEYVGDDERHAARGSQSTYACELPAHP